MTAALQPLVSGPEPDISRPGGALPDSDSVIDLARHIAARMAPDALLDAEDVGALLKCSARYVTEQFVLSPGFPVAIRLTGPGGRRGKPKWKRSDIMAWVDAHSGGQSKRGGRPRKVID